MMMTTMMTTTIWNQRRQHVGVVAWQRMPRLQLRRRLGEIVDVVQQQQQTFDRLQRILESGYQFYSSGRTSLQYAGDGNRELSLLKIIGNAFPNVYCDVRQDIYERASKADKPGGTDMEGRKLIDLVEINALFEGLENAPKPRRREAADNFISAWTSTWASKKEGSACAALNNPASEGQLIAEAAPTAGFFNSLTAADGVVRSLPLVAEYKGQYFESMSLAICSI